MKFQFTEQLPMPNELYNFYVSMGWQQQLGLTPNQLLQAMEGSWSSLYVYQENQLIGTGRIISDGICNAYLCGLGVLCEWRGKGIGKKVVGILTDSCQQAGLHLQLMCEEDLIPYYEKLGFAPFATGLCFPK